MSSVNIKPFWIVTDDATGSIDATGSNDVIGFKDAAGFEDAIDWRSNVRIRSCQHSMSEIVVVVWKSYRQKSLKGVYNKGGCMNKNKKKIQK